MLMIFYVLLGWVVTPFAYEFFNSQTLHNTKVENFVKGWPSWLINIIICLLVGIVICFLPGGWKISFTNVFLLTCVIYFGNQFFFTSVIKPFLRRNES